jgi:hypothetical protein
MGGRTWTSIPEEGDDGKQAATARTMKCFEVRLPVESPQRSHRRKAMQPRLSIFERQFDELLD